MKGSRRKDSGGRVMHDGESQRKDGSYMFRYTNLNQERKCIYARTLNDLRAKENGIKNDLRDGIDSDAAKMTVSELVEKYYNIRRATLKRNSQRAYSTPIRRIKNSSFGKMPIGKVKRSDAQTWMKQQSESGLKRNTLAVMKTILQPAFEMAVDDDILRKNPFKFNLCDLIPDDAQKRTSIPKEEQSRYLDFIRNNSTGTWYYEILILLETGLRVSELYGLTLSDVDFQHRRITVNKQLCRTAEKPYFIETPKSASGNRVLPMSDGAYFALKRAIEERGTPTLETIVDGICGFIFLDKNERPKVAHNLDGFIGRMRKKYVEAYGEGVTFISPHVFRHTFCSNMNEAGMNPKHLQQLMGHSRIEETFNTYTHTEFEAVAESFRRAIGQG